MIVHGVAASHQSPMRHADVHNPFGPIETRWTSPNHLPINRRPRRFGVPAPR